MNRVLSIALLGTSLTFIQAAEPAAVKFPALASVEVISRFGTHGFSPMPVTNQQQLDLLKGPLKVRTTPELNALLKKLKKAAFSEETIQLIVGSDVESLKHQTKVRKAEQTLLKKHGYKDVAAAVEAINKATDKKPDVRPAAAIKKFAKSLLKHVIHADVAKAVETYFGVKIDKDDPEMKRENLVTLENVHQLMVHHMNASNPIKIALLPVLEMVIGFFKESINGVQEKNLSPEQRSLFDNAKIIGEKFVARAGTFVSDEENFKLDDDRIIEHLVLNSTTSK